MPLQANIHAAARGIVYVVLRLRCCQTNLNQQNP